MRAKWKKRFPVSRVKPFSAEIDPSFSSTLKRFDLNQARAFSNSSPWADQEEWCSIRSRFFGVAGGSARAAWKCSIVRGRTQPMSEIKSRI